MSSDLGHPGRALRGAAGETRRHEVLRRFGLPRDGEVLLYELRHPGGGVELEVDARWRGILPGAPPLELGVRPGMATDTIVVGVDLELARAVMDDAQEALRAGRDPDLRASLRARRGRD